MVSTRPLLYLSLPGVAFILGMFWFRRRYKDRKDADGKGSAAIGGKVDPQIANAVPTVLETSKSMHINGTCNGRMTNVDNDNDDNQTAKLFGKSAPIQIVQNGITNGGAGKQKQLLHQQQQQQVDSEVLKSKIQDVEQKTLRSIEEDFENLSSPLDLPDSVNRVSSFYARKVSNSHADGPVIIKATTTPKISPENSFMECKYTKETKEQNNNCNETTDKIVAEPISQLTEQTQKLEQQQKQQQQKRIVAEKTEKTVDANGNVTTSNTNPASPALSVCSVQTADSGKGSSLPRSEAAKQQSSNEKISYEFLFPTSLIGHLYGRHRNFINHINAKTNAKVSLSKTRYSGKVRICTIDGTAQQIEAALTLIRERMPSRRYPNFTMKRIQIAMPHSVVPLSNENIYNMKLHLIEGINNDVLVSTIIAGGHFFVQHPLHPSHPHLALQQRALYDRYSNMTDAPALPSMELYAVCVAPVNGVWYRVEIVELDNSVPHEQRCFVKFLDYGGFMSLRFEDLRQICAEFMLLPFQSTECVLSNVEPNGDQWSAEATDVMAKLTKGTVLQAQVAGYNAQNVPEVYLFACLGANNVVFINKELVARKLGNWIEDYTKTS